MILDELKTAVDALRDRFPNTCKGRESPPKYTLTVPIGVGGWKRFARELLEARFRLTLRVEASGEVWRWSLIRDGGRIKAITVDDTDNTFDEKFGVANTDNIGLAKFLTEIARLISSGMAIKLSLHISLTKGEITRELESEYDRTLQKVVVFLFADNFIVNIKETSLSLFEESYAEPEQRTAVILLDYPDWLSGNFLVVWGPSSGKQLRDLVCKEFKKEVKDETGESLKFRKSQSLGDFRTEWITPEFFALSDRGSADSVLSENIIGQLKTFQALLSILFLANFVEDEGADSFRVEYRGLGVTSLPGVNRSALMAQEQRHLDSVYALYDYAYDEFHVDKLEVARQLLSLMAASLDSLCMRAVEIKEQTEKSYSRVLREKVREYFEALERIEERLKTAVGEAAQGVLGLTRTASEDLYKIAGVIAGAAIGAIIKPDLSAWVGLGASLVVAAYLALVIFYHLATLEGAFALSMDQHQRYIESFRNIVGATEIQGFLADVHLQRAKDLFETKRHLAEKIYGGLLLLSLLVAYCLAAFIVIESARRAL